MARGKQIIGQDPISILLTFFAMSALVNWDDFPTDLQVDSIIAVVLMLAGLVMAMVMHFETEDDDLTEKKEQRILVYFLLALVAFFVFNRFVPDVLTYASNAANYTALTTLGFPSALFLVILVPVSEEQFNRAAWGNFLIKRAGLTVGMFLGGIEFTLYHFATYGYNTNDLGIIFAAGVVFIFVDVKTGTVTTSMLGHIVNNGFSYFQLQSSVPPPVANVVAPLFNDAAISLGVGAAITMVALFYGSNSFRRFITTGFYRHTVIQ